MAVLNKGLDGQLEPYCVVNFGEGCVKARQLVAIAFTLYLKVNTAHAADQSGITNRPFSEIATYPEHRAPTVVLPQNDSKISAEVFANLYTPLQTA